MRMRIDEAQRREESFHQQVCWMKPGDKSPSGRSLGRGACTGRLSPSVVCLTARLPEINGCSRAPGLPPVRLPPRSQDSPALPRARAPWAPHTPRGPRPRRGPSAGTQLSPRLLSAAASLPQPCPQAEGTCPSPPRVSPGAASSCRALSVLGDGFKQACDTAIALQAPHRRRALAAAQPSCPRHRPCQLRAEADEKWQSDAVGKSFPRPPQPRCFCSFPRRDSNCSQPSGEAVAARSRWLC